MEAYLVARRVKLWDDAALLAWALVLAFVMSLVMFGCMLTAAYVADVLSSPSLNESSSPPPPSGGR